MDTSGTFVASPPQSPLQPPAPHAELGVPCPHCQCAHGKPVRACCGDHVTTLCELPHALHCFACACNKAHFACIDCKKTASSPSELQCAARRRTQRDTVLHVWVPTPTAARTSNLHTPRSDDHGSGALPANVLQAFDALRFQARGATVNDLMQTALEETRGRAHLAFMHRGHEDGRQRAHGCLGSRHGDVW